MVRISSIQLLHFKSYATAHFTFHKRVVGIAGPNGCGKTNLLDAIYYLCFTKSYFAPGDAALVHRGSAGFRVSGVFDTPAGEVSVAGILRESGKKEFYWNQEPYSRMSEHIGKLPAVVVAPDDIELITGGGESRRKMMDALLCQLDTEYLKQLTAYNKILQQRNSLLRTMAESGNKSNTLLEVINEQLVPAAIFVLQKRHALLGHFLEEAIHRYRHIAANDETVEMSYLSALRAESVSAVNYHHLLMQSLPKDLALQRTTVGIHRDDLQFYLDGQPFKQMASQGQRKSLLFALKLTEYEWLEKEKGHPPLLLLDDVFEKLDNSRMSNLLLEVCTQKTGQVFITDTNAHRLQLALQKTGCAFQLIEIGG